MQTPNGARDIKERRRQYEQTEGARLRQAEWKIKKRWKRARGKKRDILGQRLAMIRGLRQAIANAKCKKIRGVPIPLDNAVSLT